MNSDIPEPILYRILDRVYPVGCTFEHESDELSPEQRLGFGKWEMVYAPSYFLIGGRSSGTGSVPSATWVVCDFSTVVSDNWSRQSGSTFTAPLDGYYYFSSSWKLESTTSAYRYLTALYINTSTVWLSDLVEGGGGNSHTSAGSTVVSLSAGDTVRLRFYHKVGSTRGFYGTSDSSVSTIYFTGCMLGGGDNYVWKRIA